VTRVEVVPGAGAVARFGDTLVWVGRAASHALLSYLTRGATSGASVRQLCDQVAGVLRSGDPEPAAPFAIVGPTPQGWVALLHGPVQCYDGTIWSIPSPGQGWQGKLLGQPSVVLIGPAGSPVPPLVSDSPFHLEQGVVPGGGFYLTRTPPPGAADTAFQAAGPAAQAPFAPPAPTAGSPVDEPGGTPPVETADLAPAALVTLPPLPPAGSPDPLAADAPMVSGLRCAGGHFNHPASPVCVTCGRSLGEEAIPASGPRPPVGVLLRDDGAVFTVDRGYVLGSDPTTDPAVTRGGARPLTLTGSDVLAPAHAELLVEGWQASLVDRGSSAGTFALPPDHDSWQRLTPHQPHRLVPGTHMALGARVLTYTSPWPA
jgi:hypothetical protein